MWVISSPATVMLPRVGTSRPPRRLSKRGFAGAAGAHERHEFAGIDIEIESLQDVDLFPAAAIGFVEITNLDEARIGRYFRQL